MTITVFEHSTLEFQVVRFDGVLLREELAALGQLHEQRRDWAAADVIHMIDAALDISHLSFAQLDVLREHYRRLHQSLDFHLLRRSAWVCPNLNAWPFVEHWLAGRHNRDGQGTEVCLVKHLDEARTFDADERAAVAAWREFTLLHRLHFDPTTQGGD